MSCAAGYTSSGSTQIANCPDEGEVVVALTCTEIMCSAYSFGLGVNGTDTENACTEDVVLSAVSRTSCDLKCLEGYE